MLRVLLRSVIRYAGQRGDFARVNSGTAGALIDQDDCRPCPSGGEECGLTCDAQSFPKPTDARVRRLGTGVSARLAGEQERADPSPQLTKLPSSDSAADHVRQEDAENADDGVRRCAGLSVAGGEAGPPRARQPNPH